MVCFRIEKIVSNNSVFSINPCICMENRSLNFFSLMRLSVQNDKTPS